jgi:hypothetical protein
MTAVRQCSQVGRRLIDVDQRICGRYEAGNHGGSGHGKGKCNDIGLEPVDPSRKESDDADQQGLVRNRRVCEVKDCAQRWMLLHKGHVGLSFEAEPTIQS